jgi:DNA topoisomerase II
MKITTIQDFLENEYSNSALYDCYRSIASYIDGLKPSSRKIVYTVKKQNINHDSKVSRLASAVAMETEYLHGEVSLQSVITNMTKNFVGSNNLPLLSPNGNFGTRFIPTASAARYIFSKKSKEFDELFKKEDDFILLSQTFEGSTIEPKFFLPVIPLILINGSEGMGTGFAQKVLPRNMKDIKRNLQYLLNGKTKLKKMIPYFEGFKGKVIQGDSENSWIIQGVFRKINTSSVEIEELPIGYSLSSYLKVLASLEDKGEIKGFEDLSEDDTFKFIIKFKRSVLEQLSDSDIFSLLKLEKRVSENYTCIDENNSVVVFNSPESILISYYTIKLDYYEKRRLYLIDRIEEELSFLNSLSTFISEIVYGNLKVNNIPKKDIIESLETRYRDSILKKENCYDYLLRIPIYSFTKEKIEELAEKKKKKEEELEYYKKVTPKEIWEKEL